MGVIQSLRSQATAARAQADTQMQVSGYLGNVNKSLGSQVDQLIDGLQAVINERTKAYNGIVSKLTQQVQGKGGIGDQGVQMAFSLVKATVATISSAVMAIVPGTNNIFAALEAKIEAAVYSVEMSAVTPYTSIGDTITPALYTSAGTISSCIASSKETKTNTSNAAGAAKIASDVFNITSNLLNIVTSILQGTSISKTIESLTYDYRRMAAQLGLTTEGAPSEYRRSSGSYYFPSLGGTYSSLTPSQYNQIMDKDDPQIIPPDPEITELKNNWYVHSRFFDQGASKHLNMRDDLMLRYKSKDTKTLPPIDVDNMLMGYVGTLRRRV